MAQLAKRKTSDKKGAVIIDAERCKGCGLCVATCKQGALRTSDRLNARGYTPAEVVRPERCTGCNLCAEMCPDMAISVYRRRRIKK